jgi:hypothetical protein
MLSGSKRIEVRGQRVRRRLMLCGEDTPFLCAPLGADDTKPCAALACNFDLLRESRAP